MLNPFTPNATCTVWSDPPDSGFATILAEGVRIRQLKPWGPFDGEQYDTSVLGFLYRWVIFSDYFPPTQKTSNLSPRIFFATVDGADGDIYYAGAWSQQVMSEDERLYTYMVLRAVDWIGGGPSLIGGNRADPISGKRRSSGGNLEPAARASVSQRALFPGPHGDGDALPGRGV
jgi:hypothetical protein